MWFQQKEGPLYLGMHKSKSKHELKLLEKIPENAEATVVLVGQLDFVLLITQILQSMKEKKITAKWTKARPLDAITTLMS